MGRWKVSKLGRKAGGPPSTPIASKLAMRARRKVRQAPDDPLTLMFESFVANGREPTRVPRALRKAAQTHIKRRLKELGDLRASCRDPASRARIDAQRRWLGRWHTLSLQRGGSP